MKKKYMSLLKNIGLFTIGSFGSKIITFFLLPLYTSILTTSEYGLVDLIQSTSQLLMPLLLLSIQDATLRFSMDSQYRKEDVLSTSIKIIMRGSLILGVGLTILYCLKILNIELNYLIFLFLVFVLGSFNNCFGLYLKARNKAAVIAISGIFCTLITCFVNIVLLVVFKIGILGYMIGLVSGMFIQFFYQLFFGKIYKDFHICRYDDLSREMIKYSFPLISNSIAWWVNNASDRYILTFMAGIATNGVYAISYKIPTILTTFQGVFYNAWSISAISEFDSDDKDGFIGNNYMTYSFFSIILCSLLILLNIPIARVLYSNEYFNAWMCVPFLLVGTVFNGISQLEGALFAATKKTKEVAKTTIIGAIVNVVFNFIFIYLLGAVGAALATMCGYCITWMLRTKSLNNFVKIKINWRVHYFSVFLLIVQSILATLNLFIIIQVICFCVILILNNSILNNLKKFLFNFLRKIKKF